MEELVLKTQIEGKPDVELEEEDIYDGELELDERGSTKYCGSETGIVQLNSVQELHYFISV